MMTPRPWHWLAGRRPALRHTIRAPRLVLRPDPLLDRLAAHGPDLALAEFAAGIEAKRGGENRIRKGDRAGVARQRLEDLGRRTRLPPTAMGRAAGAWREFGELALVWRPELGGEARRWLITAGAVPDPVGTWRRGMGIDGEGQPLPGGLADRLRTARLTVDARLLPKTGDASPSLVITGPSGSAMLETTLEARFGVAGPQRRVIPARRLTETAVQLRSLVAMVDWLGAGGLPLWARLLGRPARPADIASEAGIPLALFVAGRWWAMAENPPPEAMGYSARAGGGFVELARMQPGWAGTARWRRAGDRIDIVCASMAWRAVGCAVLRTAERGPAGLAPWGAQKVVLVRVADDAGQVLGEVRVSASAPAGPDPLLWDLAAADPWAAAGEVVALLHRKVPGGVAARPGAVVWPEGGGLLPIDEHAAPLEEARRLVAEALDAGLFDERAIDPHLHPSAEAVHAELLDRYDQALARVRAEYSADQRGRLALRSGHGIGRPASGPTVEDVLAACAASTVVSRRALAERLACSRSMVARRLTTAADEDQIVAEMLVSDGMSRADARAAVVAGRAAALESIASARSAA